MCVLVTFINEDTLCRYFVLSNFDVVKLLQLHRKCSSLCKTVLKLVFSHCCRLKWLLVNGDFILSKRASMDDIHKVVQAIDNETSNQKAGQRHAQRCFEARYSLCGGDNRNPTMRTNRPDGRLTEYHAICIFLSARLLVYDFYRRCLLLR